jgi:hypothetical protein
MLRGRGLVIGLLRIVGEDDRTLAAVGELEALRGQVKRTDNRLIAVGAHLRQLVLHSFARRSEAAEGVLDRGAPIGAGDENAGNAVAVLRQTGLVQPEDELDDVGNAVVGHAFAASILEGIDGAARGQQPLFEVSGRDAWATGLAAVDGPGGRGTAGRCGRI